MKDTNQDIIRRTVPVIILMNRNYYGILGILITNITVEPDPNLFSIEVSIILQDVYMWVKIVNIEKYDLNLKNLTTLGITTVNININNILKYPDLINY